MLREGEGVAARVLKSLDVDVDRCRNEILSELDPNFASTEEKESSVVGGEGDEPDEKGKDVKTPALKAFGRTLLNWPKKESLIRLWVVHLKYAGLPNALPPYQE